MSKSDLDATWVDCLATYKQTLSTMKPWDVNCPPHVDKDAMVSSPEMMDGKTDTGFNWKSVGSIGNVFAPNSKCAPRDVSNLTADELLDLMDVFFMKESMYLRGSHVMQTFLSFVYLHRMDLLAQRAPVLHLYVRCVIRTLVLVIQHVHTAGVRDDEESIPLPPEIPHELDVAVEQIMAELEIVIKQTKDARIRNRLTFRLHLLQALSQSSLAATSRTNAGKWFDIVQAALQALEGMNRTECAAKEPTMDVTLFRHEESHCWLTVQAVHKAAPLPTFAAATAVFTDILTQLKSLSQLLEVHSLLQVTIFLESFALKKPVLITRSIASQFIISEKSFESFLCRPSITSWFWKLFALSFGAPIYGLLADNDEASMNDVVKFRCVTSGALAADDKVEAAMRQETHNAMRAWGHIMCNQLLSFWKSLLFNRGRCHRRLMNIIEGFADIRPQTLELEERLFSIRRTGLPKGSPQDEQTHIERAAVLSNFVTECIVQMMQMVVSMTLQLDLLSPAEVIPAHWFISFLNGVRQDNFTKLFIGAGRQLRVPPNRAGKKQAPTVNPLITTRRDTLPLRSYALQANINRALSDAACYTAYALQLKNLIPFKLPTTSLVGPDLIFNTRFRVFTLFGPPLFVPYKEICNAVEREAQRAVGEPATAAALIPHMIAIAKRSADDVKPFTTLADSAPFETEFIQAAERTARSMSAALSMLQTMDDKSLEKMSVQMEAPYRPNFFTVTLKRNVAAN